MTDIVEPLREHEWGGTKPSISKTQPLSSRPCARKTMT
jgi:hypothetical protein